MVWSKPSKLVGRRPLASISAITRGRASSATRRPPAASIPPTKQPMLPAPATPIVRPEFISICLFCKNYRRTGFDSRMVGCCLSNAKKASGARLVTVIGHRYVHPGADTLQETTMGLLDVLNGMQNGPRGPSTPSAQSDSGGGMSPMTMAILALLAWKAVKHFGGSQPGAAPAAPSAPPKLPGNVTASLPGGGGGLSDVLKGGLGGLLAGGAAGSVLSGGLGDLLNQFQQKGQGDAANSWVSNGRKKQI